MARRLALAPALIAALAFAGCGGGSEESEPAPAVPAPSANVVPAAGQSPSVAVHDRKRAEKRFRPWKERIENATPPKGKQWTQAETERFGETVADAAEVAEYEYELLRKIALPQDTEALYKVTEFLDLEEDGLLLVHRIGLEFREHNDLEGTIGVLERADDWARDYKRAANAVFADACAD